MIPSYFPQCEDCKRHTANASGVCVRCLDREALEENLGLPEHRKRVFERRQKDAERKAKAKAKAKG